MNISKLVRGCAAVTGAVAMVGGFTTVTAGAAAPRGLNAGDMATKVQELMQGGAVATEASAWASRLPTQQQAAARNGGVQAQAVNDPDGDGASNEPPSDINQNGVDDDQDPTIAVVETSQGLVVLGLAEPTNEEMRNFAIDSATHAANNISLPYGLISYDIVNATDPVEMILILEDNGSGATDLYKGTASSVSKYADDYYNQDTDPDTGVTLDVWAFGIEDGAAGDGDGTTNGTISDPIGPGIQTGPAPTTTTTAVVASTTSTTAAPNESTTTTTVVRGSTTTTSSTSTTSSSVVPTTSTTAHVTSSTTSTTILSSGDPDGDGASNEVAGVDANDNGIPDDHDPTVALFDSPDGFVAAVVIGAGEFRELHYVGVHNVGNIATPNGLLSFKLVNAPGTTSVGVVWVRNSASTNTLFKGSETSLSPWTVTRDDSDDKLLAFLYAVQDGGHGDADGVANNVIEDPVAPGYLTSGPTATTAATGGTTAVAGRVLARTGHDATLPTAAGAALIGLGMALMAVAWRPKGLHFR